MAPTVAAMGEEEGAGAMSKLATDKGDCALLAESGREISYSRGVYILGFGFLGVFGGFQAAQGLQTSLNAELGFINLACLYGTFTVLCLIAPPLLSSLEAKVGLNKIMVVSSVAYVGMILSNLYTKVWALPIAMNVLVGVAAPLLWTCQNDYVGRCAYHASQAGVESLETLTARFNGTFFSIYQFSGMIGNIVASTLMLLFATQQWLKDVLFFVLGGVAVAGAVTFILLPRVASGEAQAELPSLTATGALAVGDKRMALMVPLIFTNGMTLGFLFGDFPADIVCPVIGASFTGFVMATFFGVNCVATLCWSSVIAKKVVSRRTAYITATCCELAFFTVKLVWQHPDNYEKDGSEWKKVGGDPAVLDVLCVFGLVALFALGDAYWESGPAGTLQNFFMGTSNIIPAMANLKMWQSLGFAVQFVLGATMGDFPEIRAAILLCMLSISIVSLLILDRSVPLQ